MRIPRTIVFDRDGTLLDFIEMFHRFILDLHEAEGVAPPPRERIVGHDFWESIRSGELRIGSVRVRDRIDEVPRAYMTLGSLYPGTRDALLTLADRGVRMALVSGWVGTEATHSLLAREGLAECFELVRTADDLAGADGPPPRGGIAKQTLLRHSLEALGADPRDALMVGDAPEDVEAGLAVGTGTVAVLTGNGTPLRGRIESLGPDHIISGVSAMVDLFGSGEGGPQ